MARKASSTIVQEELYPLPSEAPDREPFDDSRLLDLEAEQESPFLRGQKRVSVRRGSLPKQTAHRLKWFTLAVVAFAILGAMAASLYSYGKHSWRFRIDSSDQIEISGAQHVPKAQIMEVMGGDIGRNIFFIPLAQRKLQLEQIPWVESASVMRFVPNRLGVEIHERTPVAFARIGSRISLIDAGGTVMELAPNGKKKYSFPVIAGMNSGEPLSTRSARMKNYNELVQQLDSGGASYSRELSEVDLSDPEDVKVVVADPLEGRPFGLLRHSQISPHRRSKDWPSSRDLVVRNNFTAWWNCTMKTACKHTEIAGAMGGPQSFHSFVILHKLGLI